MDKLTCTKKLETPEYQAIQNEEIPELNLEEQVGKIRILLGIFNNIEANVKTDSPLVHLHLVINPCKTYMLPTNADFDYGCYIPEGEMEING